MISREKGHGDFVKVELNNEVRTLLRDVAAGRLNSHMGVQGFSAQNMPKAYKRKVHGNWMAVILIGGRSIRGVFKCYFDVNTWKQKQGVVTDEERKISDFMKEFCNLVAGGLQQILGDKEMAVGISLPIVTRGFDEVFEKLPNEGDYYDLWNVANKELDLTCSLSLSSLRGASVLSMIENLEECADDDGEVDFL